MRIKVITLVVSLFTVLSSSGCGGGSGGAAPESTPATQQVFNQGQVMPAGFQIIGSSGNVQIDGNYVNLGLIAKGTVTIPAAGSISTSAVNASAITPQIVVTGSTPILCIAPKIVRANIGRVQQSGSTFSYTIIGGASSAGETFNWYLFDQMSLTTQGTSGLQVFNASGQIVFNSNANPMRIAAVGQVPNVSLSGNPSTSINAPTAGTYAACLTQSRMYYQALGAGNFGQLYGDGVTITSSGSTIGAFLIALPPNNISMSEMTNGGPILLVDVSGL